MAKGITKKRRSRTVNIHYVRADVEKRLHDYDAALGQFVSSFAHVETIMFYVLVYYSGVTHQTARAIFSGVRMDTAAGHLRRMMEQKRIRGRERAHLEKALTQLARISTVRNWILHHGVEHAATKRARTTNELRALNRLRARSYSVTAKDLEDMHEDLMEISHGLYLLNTGPRVLKRQRGEVAEMLRAPWRYAPPPPKQRRRPQRGKPAKQQRPQQPSPE